jgi:hypothetical protein
MIYLDCRFVYDLVHFPNGKSRYDWGIHRECVFICLVGKHRYVNCLYLGA